MSTDNKVFGENENQNENANVTSADALKLLVGDGAKYKTVEDLALATLHGQTHIATLEKENATFRESSSKQSSIEDILAAVKNQQVNQTPVVDDNQLLADQQKPDSTPVDIEATVAEMLNKRDSANNATANVAAVQAALSNALGDNAGSIFTKRGEELGMDLDALSASNPQAVIKLVLQQRPAAHQDVNLPPSNFSGNLEQTNAVGDLNHEAIQVMFKAGTIKRHQKIQMENEQLTKLGSARYWNKK